MVVAWEGDGGSSELECPDGSRPRDRAVNSCSSARRQSLYRSWVSRVGKGTWRTAARVDDGCGAMVPAGSSSELCLRFLPAGIAFAGWEAREQVVGGEARL